MPSPDQLAEDTARVEIYPSEQQKQQWVDEKSDDQSLSKYVISQVNTARADQQVGATAGGDTAAVEELEAEIERLKQTLEQERQRNAGRRQIDDPGVVKQFVEEVPKQLDELLKEIVESGCLDQFVRKRVEDTLYFLAEQGEVEYTRDKLTGWRLTGRGDDR